MKTPITYYGGKQQMLKYILPLVPPHTVYTESFLGGGALFFAKEPSPIEVLNDVNGELINFYRTIVTDFNSLKMEVDSTLYSRAQHSHASYIYKNPAYFTNVQRAWALFTLSKTCIYSIIGSSFGYSKWVSNKGPIRIHNEKTRFDLSLKVRLENCSIENDDALKVIARYDTGDAFHFIDPPYIGTSMGHYSGLFNELDLQELLTLCGTLKGKFMLTTRPNEIIKDFASTNSYNIHIVSDKVLRTTSKLKTCSRVDEWMVTNY